MNESANRMTEPVSPPANSAVADWLGEDAYRYWEAIRQLIEQSYPGFFTPEWLYGGKKHGWSLRYKKNRSFCTLVPEKKRCALVIVFGADERAKVEAIKNSLTTKTRMEYDRTTTYHDGKWLLLAIDTDSVVKDVMLLLAVKRRPANTKNA
jgi:hypothetical protein